MFHRGVGLLVRNFVILFFFGLGFVPLSSELKAASLKNSDVKSLTESSDNVYRVKVLGEENVDIDGFPFSQLNVQILETFKGAEPKSEIAAFHIPGGKRGKTRLYFSGAPKFAVNKEYVVFLNQVPGENRVTRLTGWDALMVAREESSGERFLVKMRDETSPQHSHNHADHKDEHRHGHRSHALSVGEVQKAQPRFRSYDETVAEIFSVD